MAEVSGISVGITGLGAYVPERIVTNAEIAQLFGVTPEWIESMSGIRQRHYAAPDQAASDLGIIAARRAMEQAKVLPPDLDLIIVATATPDMQFPSTACLIQDGIGAHSCPAFDLTANCSGFVYGLTVGAQFITNGFYKTVLVIGTEVCSRANDTTNLDTYMLFGDGAGAAILQAVPNGYGILSACLGADGSGGSFMMAQAGRSRLPATPELLAQNMHKAQMNGAEIFVFAMRTLPKVTLQALDLANLTTNDLKLIVPHQANQRIIAAAARRMELPIEKFLVNMERFGNTSSATIPIALVEAVSAGLVKSGDVIALTGFGGGLTWGSVILRWI